MFLKAFFGNLCSHLFLLVWILLHKIVWNCILWMVFFLFIFLLNWLIVTDIRLSFATFFTKFKTFAIKIKLLVLSFLCLSKAIKRREDVPNCTVIGVVFTYYLVNVFLVHHVIIVYRNSQRSTETWTDILPCWSIA